MTEVRRLVPGDDALVLAAPELFDGPPTGEATATFLARDGHHLLMAFDGRRAVGFVTGVEMTHPDDDNPAAVRTYEAAGGVPEPLTRLIAWTWSGVR